MDITTINAEDLIKTLHYNERYPDGTKSLQDIRVQFDTALYALYREQLRLSQRVSVAVEGVHYAAGDKRRWLSSGRHSYQEWAWSLGEAEERAQERADTDTTYIGSRAKEALQDLAEARAALRACKDTQRPLQEAYRARPWTRAFLVTDGHVHSSTDCSTCYSTTAFSWLVQFADHDEAEIVEAAGERACTVCYPSAPTLRSFEKASALFTEEEAERILARARRLDEKRERLAKKIEKALTPDGSEFVVRGQGWREYFKTERSAVIWAVDQLAKAQSSYYRSIVTAEHIEAVEAIAHAVAVKHGRQYDDVKAEFNKKATAKARKEYA